MKLLSTLISLLSVTTLVSAVPEAPEEIAARKQIKEYKKKYNKYVYDTIKNRKTGCTKQKLLVRKEWFVLPIPPTSNPSVHYLTHPQTGAPCPSPTAQATSTQSTA